MQAQQQVPVQGRAGEVVRQEMGPARLLAEGKGRPEGQGSGQEAPREPAPRPPEQEEEGHQGERRGGVRARKAGRAGQFRRPRLPEPDIGPVAPEAGKVSRAVRIRRELEGADEARAEHDRECDVGRGGPERLEPPVPDRRGEQGQRRDPDGPDECRAGLVQQRSCPPGPGAQPRSVRPVEEERRRHPPVEIEDIDEDHRGRPEEGRDEQIG